ncbi:hypothetical protein SAMN05661080_04528 [Modestobacter sp. DSM 44400]|uniref:hypothetical protein n=1 Tax=Modestobacter sp. DSM 44400 TaxID=1550230 RepID=UPI00089D4F9C|nr:hypothetical protein [Modestobacter sp. DSM 44400]SDY76221.1 hypothetical protein SAMN05661080_04528 [Modestobacter sp. DSM 44400]
MSGLAAGLLPLALLGLDALALRPTAVPGADSGAHEGWVRPLVLLGQGDVDRARAALAELPDSPHDLLFEARSCLLATAAVWVGDRPRMERLHTQLLPAGTSSPGPAAAC